MSEVVSLPPEANLQVPVPPEPQLFPHEPNPEASSSSPTSVFEKVKRAAGKVFERHGVVYKRGGGRPRKDGLPNALDVPINVPPSAVPALAAAPSALPAQEGLDPALVRRCCSAVAKAVTGFLDKILYKKALRAKHSAEEARQLVADTSITQAEIDGFSELAEICLRKYGVGTEYAPEIGIGCIVVGVSLRYGLALKAVEPEKPKIVPLNTEAAKIMEEAQKNERPKV